MSEVTIKKGHPPGLYTLFFSEMWERFCYYGMRALLTLYLVKSLLNGDAQAALIYGAYTGLVYAAPIWGGRMADLFLGYRLAVIVGAIMMAVGEFLILGGDQTFLMVGMGALIIGNGYFKANISTIVGKLYEDGDPRRDSGFTIFYIGINIGALLATTVVAFVGETYGFDKGFALAGFGMLAAGLIFWFGRKRYAHAPGVDMPEAGKKKVLGPLNMAYTVIIGSFALIALCYFLILNNQFLDYIFLGLFVFVAYSLIRAGIKEDRLEQTKVWAHRMIALVIFIVINIVFWACFEQAGTSLTLFADRNVDRVIFGWEMPASMTQFFNPAFIIIIGSVFSVMWIKLTKIGRNPSIPMKFSYGIFQLGLGFLVTYLGFQMESNSLVPLLTLVFLYLFHTTGELFLSPIGLSMVTKLSPKKMAGTAMGAWFLSFAIANFVGGKIATLTAGDSGKSAQTEEPALETGLTVKDGLKEMDQLARFEDWQPKDWKPISDDYGKNLDLGTWLGIHDWVVLREAAEAGTSFDDWLNARPGNDFESESEWITTENFEGLRERVDAIAEADKVAGDEAGISYDDWRYFKPGIDDLEGNSLSIPAALDQQMTTVQAASLDKYVGVFTTIGLVLLGFALLIALIARPLNKLMHGIR